jgi:T-complex protein 1 subunit theta
VRAVIPAIASKQYGSEDLLAGLVAEAALSVMPENPKTFNVDNVRVVKIMGGSLAGSKVVQGMVFGREPEGKDPLSLCCSVLSTHISSLSGDIKKVTKAKVAVFTNPIDTAQTETKGTVLIKNADEMLNFTRGEEKHMEKVSISVMSTLGRHPLNPTHRYSKSSPTRV